MKNQDTYKSILVIVVGFIALAWIFKVPYLAEIALILGAIAIFSDSFAKMIERVWLKFAMAIGFINSKILLTIVYFVFLLPVALVSRLFTNDPLMLHGKNSASLYHTRNHRYEKGDLEKIW